MNTLKAEYTAAWLVVGVAVVVAEVGGFEWAWTPLFVIGFLVEVLAIRRAKQGDTLSEHLWAFQDGGWARSVLVAGIAFFITWRFYQLGPGGDLGRLILSWTFGVWLGLHLLSRGKWG